MPRKWRSQHVHPIVECFDTNVTVQIRLRPSFPCPYSLTCKRGYAHFSCGAELALPVVATGALGDPTYPA